MEISLEELFARLNAPSASQAEESEKRSMIKTLLADDALAQERAGLRQLAFDILTGSPWPSSEKLAEALALNDAAAEEGPALMNRPGSLGDAMRACYGVGDALIRRILELEVDIHREWIARVERGDDPPAAITEAESPRYKTASLYNGYGATLHDLNHKTGDASLLRRADVALNKAELLLRPTDPPEALLQVLANRLYVWAGLEDWEACKARAKDFDNVVAALGQENPVLAAHPVLRSRMIKAKGATALGFFHAASPAEALERFQRIDGRAGQKPSSQTQELALFTASPDFPVIAFVRRANIVEAMALPEFSRNSVMDALAKRWLPAYSRLKKREAGSFREAIDAVSADLSKAFAPAAAMLNPTPPILRIASSDVLAYLPLHLIKAQGRTLLEGWEVRYAAPAEECKAVAETATKERDRKILLVENPRGDLPSAAFEAQTIRDLLGVHRVLPGPKATKAKLKTAMREMAGVDYFHFAGHAAHAWSDDQEAYLALADGERWTASEIASEARMRSGALVVLSACESGAPDSYRIPYNFGSLPRAFLQAGARGVIGALWPVRDDATGLLMKCFYTLHLKGAHPAEALQKAQLWLRDTTEATLLENQGDLVRALRSEDEDQGLGVEDDEADLQAKRPYAHPYFWAGFVYTGA